MEKQNFDPENIDGERSHSLLSECERRLKNARTVNLSMQVQSIPTEKETFLYTDV